MAQENKTLPRGLWYEAPKRRFRVRRYHNGITYLKGYYRTLAEAEAALEELNEYLSTIPKERKKQRRGNERKTLPAPDRSLSGHAESLRQRQKQSDSIRS